MIEECGGISLARYIYNLIVFAIKNPKALRMMVVTNEDDEGNEYKPMYDYEPTEGHLTEDVEFYYGEDIDYMREEYEEADGYKENAVCV